MGRPPPVDLLLLAGCDPLGLGEGLRFWSSACSTRAISPDAMVVLGRHLQDIRSKLDPWAAER